MQQSAMFAPESNWSIPEIFPKFADDERIAVDLETYDPYLLTSGPGWASNRGHVVGVGVATKDWKGYFPIRHEGGGNLDEAVVLRWVKNTLSSTEREVIFHNGVYDVGCVGKRGSGRKGLNPCFYVCCSNRR